MSDYNYTRFPLDGDMKDFLRFPDVARVGSQAADGVLLDAKDGTAVHLGDVYRLGVTVLEFGSFT